MTARIGTLLAVGRERLATRSGMFALDRLFDLGRGQPALALSIGDTGGREPLLARVHSSCVTSEAFGGCDCDCAEQLASAVDALARAGRGLLVYLMQEGRGAGFVAKARDRMMVQASGERIGTFEAYARMGLPHDGRRYDEVAAVRELLEIEAPLLLLTNSPDKVSALERAKVPLAGTRPLRHRPSPFNRHYLASKFASGHALHAPAPGAGAPLPARVDWFEPYLLPDAPRFAAVASYLLPVRHPDAPERQGWLRVEVYYDLARGCERVVLDGDVAGARRPAAAGLVLLQRLVERLPLREPGAAARAWSAARARLLEAGAGRVLFLGADEEGPPDAPTRALLEREPLAP